jgi:hypothetical protein
MVLSPGGLAYDLDGYDLLDDPLFDLGLTIDLRVE